MSSLGEEFSELVLDEFLFNGELKQIMDITNVGRVLSKMLGIEVKEQMKRIENALVAGSRAILVMISSIKWLVERLLG